MVLVELLYLDLLPWYQIAKSREVLHATYININLLSNSLLREISFKRF